MINQPTAISLKFFSKKVCGIPVCALPQILYALHIGFTLDLKFGFTQN